MNIWFWVILWAAILVVTVFAYAQLLNSLKQKSQRLTNQLQYLEQKLASFEEVANQTSTFEPEASAIEQGELAVSVKFAQVQHQRRKAKAERTRRLISGLKNESRKL